MAGLLEHLAARVGFVHAKRVYRSFRRALGDVDGTQERVLRRVLATIAGSEFGRRHDLRAVRTPNELRRAVPLARYEDFRPYIERVADGDTNALFAAGQQVRMFATSSGTTALPKWIPVTDAFVADYRRGWNTFGLKMLTDHPRAVLRAILQSSGRYDVGLTRGGIPYGAVTGLLAQTQKRIVRRFYVGRPELAHLEDAQARYYALMRLGVGRDVAFAITANPATMIQMARAADEHSETLIGDVRDGTLAEQLILDAGLRRQLAVGLRPDPARAAELSRLRGRHGALRPRDYWKIEFLACWTGGSMGHYLQRLADWWGPVPVRDVGLLASEGRVSIPLEDGTPVGVLDATSAVFEFIPAESAESEHPDTLRPREVEVGREYAVVLTNTSGLVRYRLGDVVRVHGWLDESPLMEFLYRSGGVSSVAGEKLTENHVAAAVKSATARLGLKEFDFVVAPCWGDPPVYRLSCSAAGGMGLAEAVDLALAEQNEEYASRRKSNRLGPLRVRELPPAVIPGMDRRLARERSAAAEQYKRPSLFVMPGADDEALWPGAADNPDTSA